MGKLLLKFGIYTFIIYLFSLVGLIGDLNIKTILILSAIFTGVNTLIRPIFVSIALPFNFITFGLASVFANLLALVIANAIAGKVLVGFWVMMLLSFVIMLGDDIIRHIRNSTKRNAVIGGKA